MSHLPRGWEELRLDEATEVILGQAPPGAAYNRERNGLPLFQGKAEFGVFYPEPRVWTTDASKIAEIGDVLLSVRAPVGPTNLAPTRCAIGRGLAALRPRNGMSSRYLLYVMRRTAGQLSDEATGTTFAAVSGKTIRAHRIPVAPVEEQERIVAAIEEEFSHIDVAGSLLTSIDRRLKSLRQSAIDNALAGEFVQLKDLLAEPLRNGHSARATSNGTGVRTLTLTAVTQGDFSERNTKLTTANPATVRDLWLRPGDILIERSNTPDLVGTARMYRGPEDFAIFPDLLIRVRISDAADPRYVELALQSTQLRRYFKENAQGISGSMPKISQPTIERAAIPVPSITRQSELVANAESNATTLHNLGDALEGARRRKEALRSSILAAAFTGRLAA